MVAYFITAIACYNGKVIRVPRTFGFFLDFERAVRAVETNECDMIECYHDYLVIERIGEGIHPLTNPEKPGEETWFKSEGENTWVRCDKPEFAAKTINWALG
jgi:hypothetical protein